MSALGKKIFRVTGRVVDRKTNAGVAALKVEAWDKDLIIKITVGNAVTDAQGVFHMEFEKSAFRTLFADRDGILFFKVFRNDRLVASTENSVFWSRDTADNELLIQVDISAGEAPPPAEPAEPFIVSGFLRLSPATPIAAATVRVFNSIFPETMVGEALTDASGHYEIQFAGIQPGSAVVVQHLVRAFDSKGNLLVASAPFFPQPTQTLDLVAENPALDEPFAISGQVCTATNSPIAKATVKLFGTLNDQEEFIKDTQADTEGRYELSYLPGKYKVTVNPDARLRLRAFDQDGKFLKESPLFQASPEDHWDAIVDAVTPPTPTPPFIIQGRVTIKGDGNFVDGIVQAFTVSDGRDKQLGNDASTENAGLYKISFLDAVTAVFVRVVDKEGRERAHSDTFPAQQPLTIDLAVEPLLDEGIVKGQVRLADGSGFTSGFVRAYNKNCLHGESPLGNPADTLRDGHYEISYPLSPSANGPSKSVNLIVRVFNLNNDQIAPPQMRFKAGPIAEVDFDLTGADFRGLSEYEKLLAALTPNLEGFALASLNADQVLCLSDMTQLDAVQIAFAVVAARLAPSTGLPAEAFYAFFKGNLPTNLSGLLSQTADEQRAALQSAIDNNWIPAQFRTQINPILNRLHQLIIDQAFQPVVAGRTSLGVLLNTALSSPTKPQTFLNLFFNYEGTVQDFWHSLSTDADLKNDVGKLQFTLQVSALTGNHLPMVQTLLAMRAQNKLSSVRDLVGADWEKIIHESASGSVLTFPPEVTGLDSVEKTKNYVRILSNIVEDAFPTAVISNRLLNDTQFNPPHKAETISFFTNHMDFEITTTNIRSYLVAKGETLPAGVVNQLEAIQRVRNVAPGYTTMSVLLTDGISSASEISRLSKETFTARYADAFGGQTEALALYDRSRSAAAHALNVVTDIRDTIFGVNPYVVAKVSPDAIPDLETLFGSLDFCECEACSSVLSPAAYLVDLLHFLKDRQAKNTLDSVLAVLFKRRPDIGAIELSCKNTNTLVLYIDLLNEVLEAAVSSLAFDAATVPQTGGTAEELSASPEHVDERAYDTLAQAVYPWQLPFNLYVEQVRAYLGNLGVKRDELMQAFQSTLQSGTTPAIKNPTDENITAEFLVMTARERQILTDQTQTEVWKYWGYTAPQTSLANNLLGVRTFLQRSGLTYAELIDLLSLRFINPNQQNRTIHIQEDSSCNLDDMHLAGLNDLVLSKIHRFVRLWRKLGWTMKELDMALTALGAVDISDPVLAKLADVKRLKEDLKRPLEQLLSLWADLDTDGEDSLYNRLFLNKAISNPVDEAFKRPFRVPNDPLTEHVSTILAALRVSAADLDAIRSDAGLLDKTNPPQLAPLNLENLSKLYGYAILAQGLGLTIDDLLALKAITGADPLQKQTTGSTRTFVKQVGRVRASGFSVAELDYLLRAQPSPSKIAPADEDIANALKEVRAGLQAMLAENQYPPETSDLSGEQTKRNLKLLNFDDAIIEGILATINGTVVYETALASLPPGLVFPPELREKIAYDQGTQKLRFVGPMSLTERGDDAQGLLGLSGDLTYRAAIQALFDTPRDFIFDKLRALEAPAFSAALSALPANLTLPSEMRDRIYYNQEFSELRFNGAMKDDEKTRLLNLSTPSTDQQYQDAINSLFNAPDTLVPQLKPLLSHAEVSELFDAPLLAQEKFSRLLAKILPHLRNLLSQSLVKQKISDALKINLSITDQLLTEMVNSPIHPGEKSIAEFLAPGFVESDTNLAITAAAFPNQFKMFKALHKISLLVSKFKITPKELNWVFLHAPGVNWLNFNALPPFATDPASVLFDGWSRLVDLFQLRDQVPKGVDALSEIFALAQDASTERDKLLSRVSELMGWNPDDVNFLVSNQGLGIQVPNGFKDEQALIRLTVCFAIIAQLGMRAADWRAWIKPDFSPDSSNALLAADDARRLKNAVKTKYEDAQWLAIAKPINDALRQKQRTALVAYLLAHPNPAKGQNWKDANGLHDYFLMDVEMSACLSTSRIKQAISSVQLFVQRCLMNLEPEVIANAKEDGKWNEWKWMKHYRVWEANRKVFLYPENYIEPELRDDKTPFFIDLENELIQNEVTLDTAEEAFLHYLEKLDEVARLEVVGMYHQLETDVAGKATIDIWHIFARTAGVPHHYYYRQWVDHSRWTAWQKVEVAIEGDHLIPVVWNRRLYLFWPIFKEESNRQPITMPAPGGQLIEAPVFLKTQIAWSEFKNKKWTAKKVSNQFLTPPKLSPDTSLFYFWAEIKDGQLDIKCERHIFNDVQELFYFRVGDFRFDGCNNDPKAIKTITLTSSGLPRDIPLLSSAQKNTRTENMALVEISSDDAPDIADLLFLRDQQGQDRIVLDKTPGTFRLLLPHQDATFNSQDPFFFYDSQRTFFVIPEKPFGATTDWGNGSLITPNVIDDFLGTYYRPQIIFQFDSSATITPTGLRSAGASRNALVAMKNVMPNQALDNRAASSSPLPDLAVTGGVNVGVPITTVFNVGDILDNNLSLNSPVLPGPRLSTLYHFKTFYHPFVCLFIRELNRNGIDGLLQRDIQRDPLMFLKSPQDAQPPAPFSFRDTYLNPPLSLRLAQPPSPVAVPNPEDVDFLTDGAYSQYNWELFFHAPLLIADRLSHNQRFEDAQKWFHYIFDPTDTSDWPSPQRYWRTLPFFNQATEAYQKQKIENLLKSQDGFDAELASQVDQWRANPFNPHLIARLRTVAYQKTVVMKYIDNLIAWGDQLFRQDTLESINEAAQLYILASSILGPRPQAIQRQATPQAQTYYSITGQLDDFSNALVRAENMIAVNGGSDISSPAVEPSMGATLPLFCVPKNDQLLAYWDTVADRLFKIRNCMNIEGIVRQLPLFEPPINPALLVRAAAAGLDIGAVLNEVNAALPHYRYNVMSQKAGELCAEVKALGAALLSALEKRDGEALARLRSGHEITVLDAVRRVKEQQLEEANRTLEGVQASADIIAHRFNYYAGLFSGGLNEPETLHLSALARSIDFAFQQNDYNGLANALTLIPDLKLGSPTTDGITFGGSLLAAAARDQAALMGTLSSVNNTHGSSHATMGSNLRRSEEWKFQMEQADIEKTQINRQLDAALIRVQIAEQDLKNHNLQLDNAHAVDDFMRDKFTNHDLYDWMVSQLSGVYFQSYQLAYDVAKRAERAFRYELGLEDSNFIQFDNWDSLKKGLLAGERLHHDLKRMEIAYLDQNKREYELTKHVSLMLFDPTALLMLKQTDECFVDLPETVFDVDYPGHYMRRIKSVSLTIPCVIGPYMGVNCRLTLVSNSLRKNASLANDRYERTGSEDSRFRDSVGAIQSIATSTAQNDGGLFEVNFRDERYLPFEGAGAISHWHIELPKDNNAFDFNTITDVILHIRYTAREGGGLLRQKAQDALKASSQPGFVFLSARHNFPGEWHRFLHPQDPPPGGVWKQTLALKLDDDHLPFRFKGKPDNSVTLVFYLVLKNEADYAEVRSLAFGLKIDTLVVPPVVMRRFTSASNPALLALQSDPYTDRLGNLSQWSIEVSEQDIPVKLRENATPAGDHFRLKAGAIEDILIVCQITK